MFEFNLKFGKNKTPEKVVTKASTPIDADANKNLPDSFYTSLINFGSMTNSRDLLLYFFNNVSEINSIITYIAQKGADIPVRHVKVLANGKQKDLGETDIIKKLKKPNHLNDGRVFTINALSSMFVYGYIPLNIEKPVGWPDINQMFLIPGNNFYPIPERCVNEYGLPVSGTDFRTNPVVKYRMFIDNVKYDMKPEEVILINDSNLTFDNGAYLVGQSRLYSAIRSIRTLDYIYDTVNTLIANKGAEGFLTKRSKAGEVDHAWWDDSLDKKAVENKLYSFGLTGGRRPIGVSTADLGFVRLSVPVSEFMPIELKQHEFRTLATALIFPSVLLNDQEGSIYNNVSLAQKAFYTDCLMPVVNSYYQSLTTGFGLNKVGEMLIADYSQVECLQADKKLEAETNNAINDLYKNLWDNNLCTRNEWLTALGLTTVADADYNKRKNELPNEQEVNTGANQATEEPPKE